MRWSLPLRIIVVQPPPGVQFALQARAGALSQQAAASGGDLCFDLELEVAESPPGGPLRLLGPHASGPPQTRFVYINSGTLAGQPGSCWTRRAKVQLGGITPALVDLVRAEQAQRLVAQFAGTGRDGGPACATVPLLYGGWAAEP